MMGDLQDKTERSEEVQEIIDRMPTINLIITFKERFNFDGESNFKKYLCTLLNYE